MLFAYLALLIFLKGTLEGLEHLSTFYVKNTIQARRNLRNQIEKRSLDINENFLTNFNDIKKSFDLVYNDIYNMRESMNKITKRLDNSKKLTKQLLEHSVVLQENLYVIIVIVFFDFNCFM